VRADVALGSWVGRPAQAGAAPGPRQRQDGRLPSLRER